MSDFLLRKPAPRSGPSVVTVETTTRCNLRCRGCFRRYDAIGERVLPMEPFRSLVEQGQGRINLINLFGMGEPLLDPLLSERIALCSDVGIRTHVSTNATLLDERACRELIDAGLSAITFSVDSLQPEVYEQARPGARYAETVRNIIRFIQIAQGDRRRPLAFVKMVADSRNLAEAGSLRSYWRERGIDDVRIVSDEFGSLADRAAIRENEHASSGPCPFLWQGPALVRADGGLYPCCAAGLGGKPLANLFQTTLHEFWTGPIMTRVRRGHLERGRYPGLDCYSCRSAKPLPLLAYPSFLADAISARRWGMRLEHWARKLQMEVTFHAIN
ncbi:MAG: radical SAM/SPASM domain-containing protein [Candidatus Alcyoniella australis]|nr:radical SAM/SPASM domain-containing protein [Candidatus Alcyoniella australis]